MTLRRLITLGFTLTGLVLAGPVSWVNLTHERSHGMVHDVFVVPLGDGTARISIVYDYAGLGQRWIGWDQDDGWMRAGPDPVLPLDQATKRADVLRQAALGDGGRRVYPVLFRSNDPAGSAFISLDRGPAWYGLQLGICCVAISLILSLPIFTTAKARR